MDKNGTINGKTPEEIKKGLECCSVSHDYCGTECPYNCYANGSAKLSLLKDALAYIQQLEERNSKLEYTLLGVMHSVDKWLDVEPYDFDKDDGTEAATRASNSREVALKAIEKLESRLAQVERERDALKFDMKQCQSAVCNACKHHYRPNPAVRHYECALLGKFSDFLDTDDERPFICGKFEWRGVCEENTKE